MGDRRSNAPALLARIRQSLHNSLICEVPLGSRRREHPLTALEELAGGLVAGEVWAVGTIGLLGLRLLRIALLNDRPESSLFWAPIRLIGLFRVRKIVRPHAKPTFQAVLRRTRPIVLRPIEVL